MTTSMAVASRRVAQRIRGAAESSGSDEGDDTRNGGVIHAGAEVNMDMDFGDPEADPEGVGLLMGDDDDLGMFFAKLIYPCPEFPSP